MYAFCTYCSADKSNAPNRVPAIQCYQSSRIRNVYAAARLLGVGFYVLSGEFGLLTADQPIHGMTTC